MNSMTGYGRGISEENGQKITIEMKSVNHRFLDLSFKLPRGFQFAEDTLRKIISKNFSRGHIDIYLNYKDDREGKIEITADFEQAKKYLEIARELEFLGYKDNFGTANAMGISDIVSVTSVEEDEDAILSLIEKAATEAAKNLLAMRATEGLQLANNIKLKQEEIAKGIKEIEERAPLVASEYRTKLAARVAEALSAVEIDENKLASEVAFFVDRSNIDEELIRLNSHLLQYTEILEKGGVVGKKLDFLTQETHREINTIGSKSADTQITKLVLHLKNQVEMIREQVQNLE